MNTYLEQHKDRFTTELIDWLRIPSISADPAYKADVVRAAEYAAERLREAGAKGVELCPTPGNPIVYGEVMVDPALPTVLVYGHYDVQPADPLDLWHTPPFEPTIRDGKIYARGSSDDKGQVYMHIKALEIMMRTNSLPCNVKFMIEGEEEVGSEHLGHFVAENKAKLAADVVLISDTAILSNENPSITVGLRGLCYMLVEIQGPNRDLHSGIYGGAVQNPVNALCEMIARLKDEKGRITIPGFYDKVEVVSDSDRAQMNKAPFDVEEYKKDLDIADIYGEEGYTTLERRSIRPTLDVNGIWGGYTGEGAKTVLPAKANAKISMRLVPHQNPDEIAELFTQYFHSLAPKGVKVTVTPHHHGLPAVTPTDSVAYRAASLAFEEAWGKTPIPMREGGSIPIVAMFEKVLGIKSLLMGFGLDSDALHSPNEHYGLFNYYMGIETIPLFYKHFAALSAK